MFSLSNTFVRNLYWQASGTSLAQLINILSFPVITRLFIPEEIGLFGLAMQYLAVFTILISFRLEHLVLWPAKDEDAQHFVKFVLRFGLLFCLFWTCVCVAVSYVTPIPSEFHIWFWLLPTIAYLLVCAQGLQQFDQRSGNFKPSGLAELANRCANSGVAIGTGFLSFGGLSLLIAVGVGQFVKAAIFFRHLSLLTGSWFDDFTRLVKIAKGLKVYRLNGSLISSHLMLSLTALLPMSYIAFEWGEEQVGYTSLVMSTLALPTAFLGNAMGQVFYQQSAKVFAQNKAFTGLMLANMKLLLVLGVPFFALIFVFGPNIYALVFGAVWAEAGHIASFYSIAAAFSFFTTPFDRSGIIVNAWWYGPLWHCVRLMTTVAVLFISWFFELSFWNFLLFLTAQMSVMYIVDGVASFIFSTRVKAFR